MMNHLVEASGDVTPVVQGLFEDFNGIPFPHFFDQKESYKTYSIWEKLGNLFYVIGSGIWAQSGLNTIGVLLEVLDGKFDDLGFLDKFLWIMTRLGWNAFIGLGFLGNLNYHMGVYARNA
jgi:hypothetical protein